MSKKNKKSGDGGGLPGWFATFSDMMTLLFAFFVLLFSLSTIDPVKVAAFSDGKKGGDAICIALLVLKLCLGVRNVVIISNNKNISSNLLENISSNWLKVNFDKFPDSLVPNISKHYIHKILHPFDEEDLNI